MNKEVEYLKKENIDSYIRFIKEVFDYEPSKENIEKLLEHDTILVLMNGEKVIASVVLEEHYEFIKAQKYYHVG